MESPTLRARQLLESMTTKTQMDGAAAALATGIANHTITAVAISRELLRQYSSNAFIAGMADAIRFAYPECARQIDLTFPDLERWASCLPCEAELAQSGRVEGFVFDLLKRCAAEELTAVWGRMIYPYIQLIAPTAP
ncbi:MAG: hypothetical protein HC800_20505 [Phormidesmis sp. RL_2_1]|nr:hypothetical protein [Phormidesmis sp. RL_2_1]